MSAVDLIGANTSNLLDPLGKDNQIHNQSVANMFDHHHHSVPANPVSNSHGQSRADSLNSQ